MSWVGPSLIAVVGTLGWLAAASAGSPALPGQCPPSAGFNPGSVADHGVASARGTTIVLEAGDSYFEPTCETGVPTGELELRVKNTGRLLHNISFEDAGIDQDVAPGETVTLKVTMAKAPRQFSCKYHRGAGMVGALLSGDAATPRRKE
jgi:plastocyanin